MGEQEIIILRRSGLTAIEIACQTRYTLTQVARALVQQAIEDNKVQADMAAEMKKEAEAGHELAMSIISVVSEVTGVPLFVMTGSSRNAYSIFVRQMAAALIWDRTGLTQRECAEILRCDHSTISVAKQAVLDKTAKRGDLKRTWQEILKRLSDEAQV